MLGAFLVLGVGPYLYMEDLLRLDRCRPLQPAHLSPALADVVTPLQWREWDRCLASHPDQRFREYVVGGIRDASGGSHMSQPSLEQRRSIATPTKS